MLERFHRQLKEALRSRACGVDWAAHLPWVLMGLQAAPKDDSGISSAELVDRQELRLPGQPMLSTDPVAEGAATPPTVQMALLTRLTSGLNQTIKIPDQLAGATHV
jgi:hypothetical protein